MKLLITLDFPPGIGGIQKYLYSIVKYTYQRNDRVFARGTIKKGFSHTHDTIQATVTFFNTPLSIINSKLTLLNMVIPYVRIWFRFQKSLEVECGNIYSAMLPWILSLIIKQPFSIYTYGTELIDLNKRSLKNMILNRVLRKAHRIITISEYARNILIKLGVGQRIEIIHPRIELPKMPGIVKRHDTGIFNVLSVGRLVKHKGYIHLITAAKELVERDKDYHFTILGNGPLYTSLKATCQSLSIEKNVLIEENFSDEMIIEAFKKANLFVLPSIETSKGVEGFGIVLLEAMAFRVPIVASASGGIPEVLDNGRCGILVEPGNTKKLVQAIGEVKNNPVLAEKNVKQAHKRLMAEYVWN